jgi:hypothetical protein
MMNEERARQLSKVWRLHQKSVQQGAPDVVIGFAASFTIDTLIAITGGSLIEAKVRDPRIINADYGQVIHACLDPASCFGDASLDTLVLLWRLEDLASIPDAAFAEAALDQLIMAIRVLREKFSGTIVLGLPPRPRPFAEGLTGFARPTPWHSLWVRCLEKVTTLATELRDVLTVDVEAEIAARGVERSIDLERNCCTGNHTRTNCCWGLVSRYYGCSAPEGWRRKNVSWLIATTPFGAGSLAKMG